MNTAPLSAEEALRLNPVEKPSGVSKRFLQGCAFRGLQIYFRYFPRPGKARVWQSVVQPYFGWRRITATSRTRFGMKMELRLPDVIQTFVCFFGIWEPLITRYVASILKDGDTTVDVGANVGYYTLLFSKAVGRNGRVYAIEASPTIFRMLENNIRLNRLQNVTACNVAVSDQACEIPIYLDMQGNLGGSTTVAEIGESKGDRVEAVVQGKALPDIVGEDVLCNARLIKIDVEGAEMSVVRGIAALLPRMGQRTEVIMEINRSALARKGVTPDDLLDLFRNAGFLPFYLPNEYNSSFYINTPRIDPQPISEFGYEHADIVFRRSPH